MRICTTTIPFTGLKIDTTLPLEPLNVRLAGGTTKKEIAFEKAPHVDIELTRTLGGILVKGVVEGPCNQECATCADPITHQIVANINWVLQSASDRAGPEDELDDPGVVLYSGDHVDLEEPLQEALILNIDPFWHPHRNQEDRCSVCNRVCSKRVYTETEGSNKTTRLGALLQGAFNSNEQND